MSETPRTSCPECGSDRVTTIVVPRPHDEQQPGRPVTQRAWRCLRCDAQWTKAS